jgi:hypothetical protein
MRSVGIVTLVMAASPVAALAAEPDAAPSFAVTGYHYAMRDQPDFGVGVATIDHRQWHFEARYNYEVRNAGSAFVGWKFKGGETVTFEVTPIVGGLFGGARGVIPGVEASVAWGPFDAYIEAEYVNDRSQDSGSYYYAWSELAWKPVEWLRVGLVGQRTHTVDSDRDLQRGVFAQVTVQRLTFSVYGFNPDSSARYVVASVGVRF